MERSRAFRRSTPSEQVEMVRSSSIFENPRALELLRLYQDVRGSFRAGRVGQVNSATLLNAAFYMASRR